MTPPHPSERSYGPFTLIEVTVGERGRLWTFRFDGQESEFDRFQAARQINQHRQFEPLLLRLGDMVNRYGFRERDFKHRGYLDNVTGYPRVYLEDPGDHLQLRLYCMRFSQKALVLGAGCIKEGGGSAIKYRGCEAAIQRTHYAYRLIKESIVKGLVSIADFESGTVANRRFGE